MAQEQTKRIVAAIAALTFSLGGVAAAAQAGEVRVGAGDLQVVIAKDEKQAIALHIGNRICPPDCNFLEFDWNKNARDAAPTALLRVR